MTATDEEEGEEEEEEEEEELFDAAAPQAPVHEGQVDVATAN